MASTVGQIVVAFALGVLGGPAGWLPAVLSQETKNTSVITGDLAQCAKSSVVQVWMRTSARIESPLHQEQTFVISRGGVGATLRFTLVVEQPVGSECRWMRPELPAGDYVALLKRSDGSGGSQGFSIGEKPLQTISIPSASVTLSGQVLRDDAPVPRATVVIDYLPWSRPSVIVIADATGHYSAVLDRPGTHEIHVLGLLTPAVKKDLVVGSNVLNVVATGAR